MVPYEKWNNLLVSDLTSDVNVNKNKGTKEQGLNRKNKYS